MKFLKTAGAIMIVVALGILGTAYSGVYNVAASSPHSTIVNWFFSTISHASVERRAEDIEVPELEDHALVLAGANDFSSMCAGCHGAPGKEPEAIGQGLNPPAPDLARSAAHLSTAELFWVTKHGIRMTGMPAWGASHDDDALWPVVAFMATLPELGADEYQALLASAAGMGHHATTDAASESASEHDHSAHDHGDAMPEKPEEPEDDGHAHKH
jgi:mono/diheme cytochrome c family protein